MAEQSDVPGEPALTWQLCINRNLTAAELRELQQNGGDLTSLLRRDEVLRVQIAKQVKARAR
jgi:hypothetical protein